VSSGKKILGLAGQAASGAASAALHPVSTASYVFGFAKGATSATFEVVRHLREGGPSVPQQRSASESTTAPAQAPAAGVTSPESEPVVGERTMFGGLNTEPAPPRMPGGGGEAFEHEPSAESRDVAHGDSAAQPREVDAWTEEAADTELDIETPVGTTGADVGYNPDTAEADLQQPLTEPLLDPATAKEIRKEAETLSKAADPNKRD
jgi:hypothetical protein